MIDYIKKVPFTLRRYKLYLPEDILRKVNFANILGIVKLLAQC